MSSQEPRKAPSKEPNVEEPPKDVSPVPDGKGEFRPKKHPHTPSEGLIAGQLHPNYQQINLQSFSKFHTSNVTRLDESQYQSVGFSLSEWIRMGRTRYVKRVHRRPASDKPAPSVIGQMS